MNAPLIISSYLEMVEICNLNTTLNAAHIRMDTPRRKYYVSFVLLSTIENLEFAHFYFVFQRVGWRSLFLLYASLVCDFIYLEIFLLLLAVSFVWSALFFLYCVTIFLLLSKAVLILGPGIMEAYNVCNVYNVCYFSF